MGEADSFYWLPVLLVAQGVVGGLDTLVNHEFIDGLPNRRAWRTETGLHAVREAIYGVLFVGFAWLAWHGAFAAFIAALLVAELAVTATDEVVENRIRVLPHNERALHVFLLINFGAILALMAPLLLDWWSLPTALGPAHHGWTSWALTFLGLASAAWAMRDLAAWRRLKSTT